MGAQGEPQPSSGSESFVQAAGANPLRETASSEPETPAVGGPPPVDPAAAPVAQDNNSLPSITPGPGYVGKSSSFPSIEGYDLQEEIGRGGMGVVYRARKLALPGRSVALKIILAGDWVNPESVVRFHKEARTVAELEHPNIVKIYDIGIQRNHLPFFTMEFVEGVALKERLEGRPFPPGEAAKVTFTLADAMAIAHQKKIVHRDLKPGNILVRGKPGALETSWNVVITDFGLVKRLSDPQGTTHDGAVLGTPEYMAPEQAAGDSRKVAEPADVYALGAILYELLTGRPPFKAPTPQETLEQVRTQEPVPLRKLNASIPRDLETICLKCLRKEPEHRYASAAHLAADLRHFLNGEPIHGRPVTLLQRVRSLIRRRRDLAWGLGAALAVCLAIFATLLAHQLRRQQWVEDQARIQAEGEAQRKKNRDHAECEQYKQAVEELRALLGHWPAKKNQLKSVLLKVKKSVPAKQLRNKAAETCRMLALWLCRYCRETDSALEVCSVAFDLYEEIGSKYGEAAVKLIQGEVRFGSRDYDKARKDYEEALELLKASLTHPNEEAEAHHQLGILHDACSLRHLAVAEYQAALRIREKLEKGEEQQSDLARTHGYLGDTYLDLGMFKEAGEQYEKSRRIRFELFRCANHDRDIARYQLARGEANFGVFYFQQGDNRRAEAPLDAAQRIQEQLIVEYPGVADYKADLARIYQQRARLLQFSPGRASEAMDLQSKARKLLAPLQRKYPAIKAYTLLLARIHIDGTLGHLAINREEARHLLKEADRLLRSILDDDRNRQKNHCPDDLYELSLVESLWGQLIGVAPGRLTVENQMAQRRHADRAIFYLELAVYLGYRQEVWLKDNVPGLRLLWTLEPARMRALVRSCRNARDKDRQKTRSLLPRPGKTAANHP